MIEVFDDVLQNPHGYRALALARQFQSIAFGPTMFHGMAEPPDNSFPSWFVRVFQDYEPTLTFLRKSPLGQKEPNFIHNDEEMGDMTAILYLNPHPPDGDGTAFWAGSQLFKKVDAQFNRALVFDAQLAHSRAIEENYGEGDEARLIQVLFARKR